MASRQDIDTERMLNVARSLSGTAITYAENASRRLTGKAVEQVMEAAQLIRQGRRIIGKILQDEDPQDWQPAEMEGRDVKGW